MDFPSLGDKKVCLPGVHPRLATRSGSEMADLHPKSRMKFGATAHL
jgi:hypothetical protein